MFRYINLEKSTAVELYQITTMAINLFICQLFSIHICFISFRITYTFIGSTPFSIYYSQKLPNFLSVMLAIIMLLYLFMFTSTT